MRFVNIPKKNILHDMLVGSKYLTIVTDGGALTTCNTFGGVITNGEHKIVDFNGKIFFNPNTSSSYRSESYGMLSGIMILEALIDYYEIDIGKKKIRLVSDCKPLIQRINQRSRRYMSTNQHIDSDVDIELQILFELKKLRKKHEVTVHHVKGHQDSIKSSAKLSHDQLMNVHANKLCKEERSLNLYYIICSLEIMQLSLLIIFPSTVNTQNMPRNITIACVHGISSKRNTYGTTIQLIQYGGTYMPKL